MKKTAILALALAGILALSACGTGTQGGTDTTSQGKQSAEGGQKTEVSCKITPLMANELTDNQWELSFMADEGQTEFTAHTTMVNALGETVYDKSNTVALNGGSGKLIISYDDVTAGKTNVGTATVEFTSEGSSQKKEYELYKLPYNMKNITLPSVGTVLNDYGSSGDLRSTCKVTAVNTEVKYLTKDGATVAISVTVKRTYASENAGSYVGFAGKAVDGKGTEVFNRSLSGKTENEEATVSFNVTFAAENGLVVTLSDD